MLAYQILPKALKFPLLPLGASHSLGLAGILPTGRRGRGPVAPCRQPQTRHRARSHLASSLSHLCGPASAGLCTRSPCSQVGLLPSQERGPPHRAVRELLAGASLPSP